MADNADIVANYCIGFQEIFHGANPALWYNITAITALTYGLLTLIVNIRVYTVLLNSRKMKGLNNEFSSPFYSVFIIASIVVGDVCKNRYLAYFRIPVGEFQINSKTILP